MTRHEAIIRLIEIARMPDGWYEGRGELAFTPEVLAFAHRVLAELPDEKLAGFAIVPCQSGGIQFEWHRGDEYEEWELTPGRAECMTMDAGSRVTMEWVREWA